MIDIFTLRILVSTSFYLYLCQATFFLIPLYASFLYFGFRFFFLMSPFIEKKVKSYIFTISIICSLLGSILILYWPLPGILFLSFGMSQLNYLIKRKAASDPKKSALNKIAQNLGNIMAGGLIFLFPLTPPAFMKISSFIILMVYIFFMFKKNIILEESTHKPLRIEKDKYKNMAWFCLGNAIGIRIFGMYIILSLYLSHKLDDDINEKYGMLILLYGVVVIAFQSITFLKKTIIPLHVPLLMLIISLLILGIPHLFRIETFIGGVMWIFFLASEEMFSPYLDYHAHCHHSFFYKELGVAVGGGLAPLLSSWGNHFLLLPLFAVCAVFFSLIFLKKR